MGHSNPGATYDINLWVTVDGVRSANFRVFLNTPWTQSGSAPSPSGCNDVGATSGWQVTITYQETDLTRAEIIPIDANETWRTTRLIQR